MLGPSEIAARRFLPALVASDRAVFAGIASATADERGGAVDKPYLAKRREEAERISSLHGGALFDGFSHLLESDEVDAVYLPLPPSLHTRWALEALKHGKHVLSEKPFAPCRSDAIEIVGEARKLNLTVQENYAFVYHRQIDVIRQTISEGRLGDVRLMRSAFGFPHRGADDFRYHASKGGGSLLDCGGYPIRLASMFLGPTARVTCSSLSEALGHDVDVYGSVTLENDEGLVAQMAFGMDNCYKCDMEIWGSKGYLSAPRIFTPTPTMETKLEVRDAAQQVTELTVGADDQFLRSIDHFALCIDDADEREKTYELVLSQSELIAQVMGEA